jgi:hypothetical protein
LYFSLKVLSGPVREETSEVNFMTRQAHVSVSFVEIYNELVNDLLDQNKRDLQIREKNGDVYIENVTTRKVFSADEIIQILKDGESLRQSAETKANKSSSRSHTIFKIQLDIDETNSSGRR